MINNELDGRIGQKEKKMDWGGEEEFSHLRN